MVASRERALTTAFLTSCACLLALGISPRCLPKEAPPPPRTSTLDVAILGAVTKPGPYTLPWGANLADLVAAAGGTTSDAEITLVNLAAPLHDGGQWIVPSRTAPTGEERISLNAATPATLERLPGIGPALAGRIVAARPFHAVEDLLGVSGIGPATLARIAEHVVP